MTMKWKSNKERSVASGIGIGVIISFVLSLLLTMVVTTLIEGEKLGDSSTNYAIMVITFISVLIGGVVSNRLVNKKMAITSTITGLIYLLIFVGMGILFFDGGFHNLWTRLLTVIVGCGASCAICITGKGSRGKRKRGYR